MPHEYEFRLVVQHHEPFHLPFPNIKTQRVVYIKPHFRFKNGILERKTVLKTEMVLHDKLWFKWVHSIESPYERWNERTHKKFLEAVGNFQCPFHVETRQVVTLDDHAQLYTFKAADGMYHMVFEWEYGTFPKQLTSLPTHWLLECLGKYREVYRTFSQFSNPSYRINDSMTRKTVKCIPELFYSDHYVVAQKWDGIFGFVYSFPNYLIERWEGGLRRKRLNMTLGDGIVYSAEKLENVVVLLDVYQVRGHPVASWNRQSVLLDYLPSLKLPEGYRAQRYYNSAFELPKADLRTDGYIMHNVEQDTIFKVKQMHTLDVVYKDGHFHMPENSFECLEDESTMVAGHVYEVSLTDGRVVRKRMDRMTGNTLQQIRNIFEEGGGWNGPEIKKTIQPKSIAKKRKRKSNI